MTSGLDFELGSLTLQVYNQKYKRKRSSWAFYTQVTQHEWPLYTDFFSFNTCFSFVKAFSLSIMNAWFTASLCDPCRIHRQFVMMFSATTSPCLSHIKEDALCQKEVAILHQEWFRQLSRFEIAKSWNFVIQLIKPHIWFAQEYSSIIVDTMRLSLVVYVTTR